MDIILHLGAHRCATTTFQAYLDQNTDRLADHGISAWTPETTRKGLFDGLICLPNVDAKFDIMRLRATHEAMNADQLIVSEENMIGTPRSNLGHAQLYPELTPRLSRFAQAFDGQVSRLGLAIRSYESYWTSAMSFAAMRGEPLPCAATCAALAAQPRTWTEIVHDIRALFPRTPLHVWTFEAFAGRPRRQLNMLSNRQDFAYRLDQSQNHKNTRYSVKQMRRRLEAQGRLDEAAMLPGAGEWQPFNPFQRHQMAVKYAQDLQHLRAHPDPLIHFTQNAAIKVQRRQNTQGPPAYDIGEQHERHAKMG